MHRLFPRPAKVCLGNLYRGRHLKVAIQSHSFAAEGQDQLNHSDRKDNITKRHRDLISDVPAELCEFGEAIDEVEDEESYPEQLDAPSDQVVAEIAEKDDEGFVATRDMRSCRHNERSDDHLLEVFEYFLGGSLDVLEVERKPSLFDVPHTFLIER